MMAISVVMRFSALNSRDNTVNYCMKVPFQETFFGQETTRFRAGARCRTRYRDIADRTDGECVRIRGLAFRLGLCPVAARLPRGHARQRARRDRGFDSS